MKKKTPQFIYHIPHSQPRVLTRGTKDQAKIILLSTHYMKTYLSSLNNALIMGKIGGQRTMTSNQVGGLSYSSNECTSGRPS